MAQVIVNSLGTTGVRVRDANIKKLTNGWHEVTLDNELVLFIADQIRESVAAPEAKKD